MYFLFIQITAYFHGCVTWMHCILMYLFNVAPVVSQKCSPVLQELQGLINRMSTTTGMSDMIKNKENL